MTTTQFVGAPPRWLFELMRFAYAWRDSLAQSLVDPVAYERARVDAKQPFGSPYTKAERAAQKQWRQGQRS